MALMVNHLDEDTFRHNERTIRQAQLLMGRLALAESGTLGESLDAPLLGGNTP